MAVPEPVKRIRTNGWALYRAFGLPSHVAPVNDLKEHYLCGHVPPCCWCRPQALDDGEGGTIIVHNSHDGRELVEEHGVN